MTSLEAERGGCARHDPRFAESSLLNWT